MVIKLVLSCPQRLSKKFPFSLAHPVHAFLFFPVSGIHVIYAVNKSKDTSRFNHLGSMICLWSSSFINSKIVGAEKINAQENFHSCNIEKCTVIRFLYKWTSRNCHSSHLTQKQRLNWWESGSSIFKIVEIPKFLVKNRTNHRKWKSKKNIEKLDRFFIFLLIIVIIGWLIILLST